MVVLFAATALLQPPMSGIEDAMIWAILTLADSRRFDLFASSGDGKLTR
jgi:hypothetical protein